MYVNILKPRNIYSATTGNHISPKQASIPVRIHKPLLGNGW